jgi:hypothetical protein
VPFLIFEFEFELITAESLRRPHSYVKLSSSLTVTLPSCASATGTLYKLMITKATDGNLLTIQAQAGDHIFFTQDANEMISSQGGSISFTPMSVLPTTTATTATSRGNFVVIGEIACSVDGIWAGYSNGSGTSNAAT